MPGLEKVLADFDIVVVKERLGLYAYQAVKAKWQYRFRLVVWVDNLVPFPANDIDQMRTVRLEVTNAADAFIVQSKAAAATLEMEGVEKERIVEIVPYVEKRIQRTKKCRAQAVERLGLTESNFIISYFGQIEWEEGLSDLAIATKVLLKEQPHLRDKIKLLFCGIGSFSNGLRETFINLGIDDTSMYFAPQREVNQDILEASDAVYIASLPARDRREGDPYRVLSFMANKVPILSNRNVLTDSLCGKHRIDFCAGSSQSLADAIFKIYKGKALVSDIVKKNLDVVSKQFSKEKARKSMLNFFAGMTKIEVKIDESGLDHQVLEVEARVKNKQYLDAIDIIESIFKIPEIPIHHKANLYRLIGDCFAKLGDIEGAKDAYIQAAELDPYSAKVYIGLGTLGLVKNSNDIAVLHFQKAVNLAPEDEMATLGLGLAFQGMEELKEAFRWVVKSLDINPENTAAIYTLVKLGHETNRYEEVERSLTRYLSLHPNDHNMMYTLGGIQFKQERYEDVIELMNKIIKVDPMDSRAHALAKQARRAMDEVAEASTSGARG